MAVILCGLLDWKRQRTAKRMIAMFVGNHVVNGTTDIASARVCGSQGANRCEQVVMNSTIIELMNVKDVCGGRIGIT